MSFFSVVAPELTTGSALTTFNTGDALTLSCSVKDQGILQIVIFGPNIKAQISTDNPTYVNITSLQTRDAGDYYCQGLYADGITKNSTSLNITGM